MGENRCMKLKVCTRYPQVIPPFFQNFIFFLHFFIPARIKAHAKPSSLPQTSVTKGHISGVVHVVVVAHPSLHVVVHVSHAVLVGVAGQERTGQGIVSVTISMQSIPMQESVGHEAVG